MVGITTTTGINLPYTWKFHHNRKQTYFASSFKRIHLSEPMNELIQLILWVNEL